ncbi:putative uncharacterized protein DDB_G0284213 isoform X2 [Drosophila yakuba]|uniref:putative uncharacterized protein DDB_G0284213 isoform X1 n=1 Tax=Drosophila yakuba TaxID=7245 RepID=UPI0019308954|nr:putative uncharacterized protein DDB_G0284213 isoform X1 [Drosophila yakuba]XP_039228383.1 putative uncharacterized protein DDB_G0284213 isoform X2 [Drosophila yakuba]
MEWSEIAKRIDDFRYRFDKSYKCINRDAVIKPETLKSHTEIVVGEYNNIVTLVNNYKNRFTPEHCNKCLRVIKSLNTRLNNIKNRRHIAINVPESLDQLVEFDPDQFKGLDESIQTGDAESDSDIETLEESDQIEFKPEPITISEMAQTVTEFIRLATSLIPEFDGRHENLQSFLDALGLLDSLKGAHETTAVSLIKTKLKGLARNLISNEQTINEIIAQLSTAVKGESVEVISAKLLNLQQKNKTANQYTQEVEKLTKALEGAYISEGISQSIANKYSTTAAVKAMTQNCSIDKVKLIMQAGTFTNMNEAISKFVNSCTEITGQSNTVLHYRRGANNNNRGGRGYNRDRNNYHNYNRGSSYNNNNYNYRGGRRGQNQGRGRVNSNQSNNNNNVRMLQNTSENSQNPLGNNQ